MIDQFLKPYYTIYYYIYCISGFKISSN